MRRLVDSALIDKTRPFPDLVYESVVWSQQEFRADGPTRSQSEELSMSFVDFPYPQPISESGPLMPGDSRFGASAIHPHISKSVSWCFLGKVFLKL